MRDPPIFLSHVDDGPPHLNAQNWLSELEKTYTTQEQRTIREAQTETVAVFDIMFF